MIKEYQLRVLPEVAASEQKLSSYLQHEEGLDAKILSVLVNDARFEGYHDIKDVHKHRLIEIQEFFETYKRLEPHKWVKIRDWKNAQEQYIAAGKALPKGYTIGINYYNAAVCADELGNQEEALGYYTKASEIENFPLKSRAMFNIGRLEEQLSRKTEAIATYGDEYRYGYY